MGNNNKKKNINGFKKNKMNKMNKNEILKKL